MASPAYRDEFVDGLLDQGRAEGEARGQVRGEAKMLIRFLTNRGFTLSDAFRNRIESCSDTDQLETWLDKAMTAPSIEAVFGD